MVLTPAACCPLTPEYPFTSRVLLHSQYFLRFTNASSLLRLIAILHRAPFAVPMAFSRLFFLNSLYLFFHKMSRAFQSLEIKKQTLCPSLSHGGEAMNSVVLNRSANLFHKNNINLYNMYIHTVYIFHSSHRVHICFILLPADFFLSCLSRRSCWPRVSERRTRWEPGGRSQRLLASRAPPPAS